MTAAHHTRDFVRDTALCNRPFASLWLAKVYVAPAGLNGCQVWSSGLLREAEVLRPTLQTLHLDFFKGTFPPTLHASLLGRTGEQDKVATELLTYYSVAKGDPPRPVGIRDRTRGRISEQSVWPLESLILRSRRTIISSIGGGNL